MLYCLELVWLILLLVLFATSILHGLPICWCVWFGCFLDYSGFNVYCYIDVWFASLIVWFTLFVWFGMCLLLLVWM